MRAKLAVGTAGIAFLAEALANVEDDGDRKHVMLMRKMHKLGAILRPDVCGVYDDEAAKRQPQPGDVVQCVKGGLGDSLIIGVVAYDGAIVIRANHLGRQEVTRREGAFA